MIGGSAELRAAMGNAVDAFGDRVALVERGRCTTYRELARMCARDIRRLDACFAGAPFLLVPHGSARGVSTLLAALACDAIPLIADPAWVPGELARAGAATGATAVVRVTDAGEWEITELSGMPATQATQATASTQKSSRATAATAATATLPATPAVEAIPADRAVLPPGTCVGRFTSGSTGAPRALAFHARALLSAASRWRDAADYTPADTVVCLATLNNGLAFNAGVLPALLGGARLAVHSGPLLPRRVARTLAAADATVLVAFPYAYQQLAAAGVVAPGGLRLAVSAAAPMPVDVRDAWAAAGRPICDYYGLVEVGPCTFNDGSAPDSLGRPLPGVSIEVVDETGTPVPAGSRGRILVGSPSMAADYADAAVPRFADQCVGGRYLTSDVGSVDGAGLLRLHGRVGPVVNLAGRKVDPDEVRAAAMALPAVRDAVVFPVRGAARTVLALVVAGDVDRLDRAGVVGGLQRDLADYKMPQIIEIVAEIPRGSAGKPLLGRLRQIAGGGVA